MPDQALIQALRTLADDAAQAGRPAGPEDARRRARRRTTRQRSALAAVAAVAVIAGTLVGTGAVRLPLPRVTGTPARQPVQGLATRPLDQLYPGAVHRPVAAGSGHGERFVPMQLTDGGEAIGVLRSDGQGLRDHVVVSTSAGEVLHLHAPEPGWTSYVAAGDDVTVAGIDVPAKDFDDHGTQRVDAWRVWCVPRTPGGGAKGAAVNMITLFNEPVPAGQAPPSVRVRGAAIEVTLFDGHQTWSRCGSSSEAPGGLPEHPVGEHLNVLVTKLGSGRITVDAEDGDPTGQVRHLVDAGSLAVAVNGWGIAYVRPGSQQVVFAPWGGAAADVVPSSGGAAHPGSNGLTVRQPADPGSPLIAVGDGRFLDAAHRAIVALTTPEAAAADEHGTLVAGRYVLVPTLDPQRVVRYELFDLGRLPAPPVPTFDQLRIAQPATPQTSSS